MPLHILGHDSCDCINIMGRNNRVTTMKVKDTHKDIFLKTLNTSLFSRFNGKFTKENTIIVDNSLVKHILNNSENFLLPASWSHKQADPSDTFLMDTLLPCLEKVHRNQDLKVAIGIRLWIGQPMLSEDPSNTKGYVKIKGAIENAHKFSFS